MKSPGSEVPIPNTMTGSPTRSLTCLQRVTVTVTVAARVSRLTQ